MEDFTRRAAAASDRVELARLLVAHLRQAVSPAWVEVWLRRSDGRFASTGEGPAGEAALHLDADAVLSEQLWRGACWDGVELATSAGALGLPHAPVGRVPIVDRRDQPVGLIALGPGAAGPYADDDRQRVSVAAGHAGVAFEVIRLAERLADRMDHDRRMERELGIARDVQARLFPERPPALAHGELAAHCVQARSVGGDYYDFLALGPGQVGLVLADVSGKGVHAALRMAHLHAHLRSQAGSAPQDPLRVLRQVNRMMHESSHPGQFATMFLGVWTDAARRLSYINCGHNPPLLLRRDGRVEWLEATATVLGLFAEWDCALGRAALEPGDVLLAYSDGVTETDGEGGEFGAERLIEAVRSRAADGAEAVVAEVLARVQAYGGGAASDDLTLLALRVR